VELRLAPEAGSENGRAQIKPIFGFVERTKMSSWPPRNSPESFYDKPLLECFPPDRRRRL